MTIFKMVGITQVSGEYIEGICERDGIEVRFGIECDTPENLNAEELDKATARLWVGGVLSALFKLERPTRSSTENVLKLLQKRKIETHMVKGHNQEATEATRQHFHLDQSQPIWLWRCNPDGKKAHVEKLKKDGKVVMYVSTGAPDSIPAAKEADISVYMHEGHSDITKSKADVVLMHPRLYDILILLDISRGAFIRIMFNLAWAAIYNTGAVIVAFGAVEHLMDKAHVRVEWVGFGELACLLPMVVVMCLMQCRNYGKKYRKIERECEREEQRVRAERAKSLRAEALKRASASRSGMNDSGHGNVLRQLSSASVSIAEPSRSVDSERGDGPVRAVRTKRSGSSVARLSVASKSSKKSVAEEVELATR